MRRLCRQEERCRIALVVDPRVRLVAACLLLALVVSSSAPLFPRLVASVSIAMALAGGMPLRLLLLRLLHPAIIVLLILALKMFTGGGETIQLFHVDQFTVIVQRAGLNEGLLIASRIFGAASVAILLGQVMTFTEIMAAFSWFRVPKGLMEVSMFAWRSLFMFYDDAGVVYTAQKNRLGYCGFRLGIRSFGAMAGMLTIRAFDNSQSMTTAMTQRGYDGNLPLLNDSSIGKGQFAGLFLFALIAAALWGIQN